MTARTNYAVVESEPKLTDEAYQLARNYLRAVALEKAWEVERDDVANALRLLAENIASPVFLRGRMECGLCLS